MKPDTGPTGERVLPVVCLDWRDASHWSWSRLECLHCQVRTNLRDDGGLPSHKTCAEVAAAALDHGVLVDPGTAA
jgi:hypothetical protein